MQLVSAGASSLGHGGNDAQKAIGISGMLLIATGYASSTDTTPPIWTLVSCYVAIALGTLFGGWRIAFRSRPHTITGAIVGVGLTQRASAVRWGVAGNIVWV